MKTELFFFLNVELHSHLQAVVEEEERDILSAVTRLVSKGDGFYPVNQTAMGRQQVSLKETVQKKTVRQLRNVPTIKLQKINQRQSKED